MKARTKTIRLHQETAKNSKSYHHHVLSPSTSTMADPTTMSPRPIYQPIHPEVRPKLDPEYVAFHDKYMQYILPDDAKPWDASPRSNPSLPPGGSPISEVGKVINVDLELFKIRAFVPQGTHDGRGWPALLWFHGGGWAIGGLGSENDFCSLMCKGETARIVR